MVGFQLSRRPSRAPFPVCALLLTWSARANGAAAAVRRLRFPQITTARLAVAATGLTALVASLRFISAGVYDTLVARLTRTNRTPGVFWT
jgi:hypothetical protein